MADPEHLVDEDLGVARCPSCLELMTVESKADDGSDAHCRCPSCGLALV